MMRGLGAWRAVSAGGTAGPPPNRATIHAYHASRLSSCGFLSFSSSWLSRTDCARTRRGPQTWTLATSPVELTYARASPSFGQFNRPSGPVADRPSELSRNIQPLGVVTFGQTEDADAGAEPLLRVRA